MAKRASSFGSAGPMGGVELAPSKKPAMPNAGSVLPSQHPLQDQIERLVSKWNGKTDVMGRDLALLGTHAYNAKTNQDYIPGVTRNGQVVHRYSDHTVVLDNKKPPQGKLGYLLARLQQS